MEKLNAGKAEEEPDQSGFFGGMDIDGIDIGKAIEYFEDEETLFKVLCSYLTNTPGLLETMNKALVEENLSSYTITVHGIKGASRGIFAEKAGSLAEKLEYASRDRDLAFVKNNHKTFLETINLLLDSIRPLIQKYRSEAGKPVKDTPDIDILKKLKEAAMEFDIENVDKAIAELEKYEYRNQQELVAWLKDEAGKSNFRQIAERLDS
jgi:HPt (histidine-containing phosphotransfer) domain-containing protein